MQGGERRNRALKRCVTKVPEVFTAGGGIVPVAVALFSGGVMQRDGAGCGCNQQAELS